MEWKQVRDDAWYLISEAKTDEERIRGTILPHLQGYEWKFYYRDEDGRVFNRNGVQTTVELAKKKVAECCTQAAGDGEDLPE